MQDFSDFVAKRNISRLHDQLQVETDAMRRAQLKELLIEEEDRLGSTVGRLEQLDRVIADGNQRVESQRTKVRCARATVVPGAARPEGLLESGHQARELAPY